MYNLIEGESPNHLNYPKTCYDGKKIETLHVLENKIKYN
jgi:hypothetical protein